MSAAVGRAIGVGANNFHVPTWPRGSHAFLQEPAVPADGPPCADTRYEVGNQTTCLLPNLRPGGFIVSGGIGRVIELHGSPCARCPGGNPRCHGACVLRRFRRRVPVREDHSGAVVVQRGKLLLGDRVARNHHHRVSGQVSDEGEPDPGVARRTFHNRGARLQFARPFRRPNHTQRGAVLDGTTRVFGLKLDVDGAAQTVTQRLQLHQRSVTHFVQD